ncbi:MAG: AbrB/MazE/SpoVT family DNA-binding domain-containing protein [bacterium]
MNKVSQKRQVTLPKVFCEKLNINAGDYVEFFEYDGKLTVIKKEQGCSKGSLSHLKAKLPMSDKASLRDGLSTA